MHSSRLAFSSVHTQHGLYFVCVAGALPLNSGLGGSVLVFGELIPEKGFQGLEFVIL